MKKVDPVSGQRKFLRLERLITLKYFYTESIKIVTFLKKIKTFSLLLLSNVM